jgi:GNAT superfamily N-acetyltransferase
VGLIHRQYVSRPSDSATLEVTIMSGRTIRRATLADAAVLAGIHVRGWQWGYRGLLPEDFLESLSPAEREPRWRERLTGHSPTRTWLVEDDSRPVAFVTCGPSKDDDAPVGAGEVYALYQEQDAAGTGAARALMAHALDDFRADGAQVALLWVLERNARARRFYESGGWRADGATKTEQAREGICCDVRYRVALV